MKAGFMDEMLAKWVDQTKDTVAGTKNGIRELGLLWRQAFTDAGDQLVAHLRQDEGRQASERAPVEHPDIEPDLWAPPSLSPEPPGTARDDLRLLDPL
jgi:hypothetical protein